MNKAKRQRIPKAQTVAVIDQLKEILSNSSAPVIVLIIDRCTVTFNDSFNTKTLTFRGNRNKHIQIDGVTSTNKPTP